MYDCDGAKQRPGGKLERMPWLEYLGKEGHTAADALTTMRRRAARSHVGELDETMRGLLNGTMRPGEATSTAVADTWACWSPCGDRVIFSGGLGMQQYRSTLQHWVAHCGLTILWACKLHCVCCLQACA
jgi:hypothetical protein